MSTPTSRGVTLGDIDLDGDLDCWIGHTYVPSEVWVNQGGRQGGWPGDFIVSAQLLGNSATTTAAMADVDGDGDLDAIEGNLSQPSRLWVNIGVYVNDCDGNGVVDTCQTDQDADGTIDECDPDIDEDGILNDCDPDQTGGADCDGNGLDDTCDPDADGDGTPDACDGDIDGDGIGNDCDVDQTGGGDCDGNGMD